VRSWLGQPHRSVLGRVANRGGLRLRITPQDRVKPLKEPLGSRDDFLALLYALGQGVPLLADLRQECVRVFGFFRFHFPKVAREGTNVGALCNTRFSNPGHSRSQIRPLELKPGQHPESKKNILRT
jgi:hypothetical protein